MITNQEVQAYLARFGYYRDEIDGIMGINTWQAVLDFLEVRRSELSSSPLDWGRDRRLIAVKQLLCKDQGLRVGSIDGLIGPMTSYAFEIYDIVSKGSPEPFWRDEYAPISKYADFNKLPDKVIWPRQSQVRTEHEAYYGKPGEHQVRLQLPYEMKIAWDLHKRVTKISCHEKVADSLNRIFMKILDHYGIDRVRQLRLDLFGGCLNVRPIKGGTVMSIHSWGAAVDIDPAHNRFKWNHHRAALAKPAYDHYWKIVKSEGWVGLGPARDFDWMHIQAARLG